MAKKMKRDLTVEEQLARGPMDLPFLMLTLLLLGIGLIMMFSASYASALYDANIRDPYYYITRQALFAVGGVVAMYFISKVNYEQLRWMSIFILIFAVVLLVLVLIPGVHTARADGVRRWIRRIGPLPSFQPSEIAKVAIILFFSAGLSKRGTRKVKQYDRHKTSGRFMEFLDRIGFTELVPYVLVLGLVAGLVVIEPHMSGAILVLIPAAAILFAAGIHMGWVAFGGGAAVAAMYFIITQTDYMAKRIAIWQDPWSDPRGDGFQTIQSLYAIGSGGLTGLGLGKSRQKFLFLPEPENDYVFSITCEELGLIGAGLILILFALLILRGYWIALHARDRFGTLLVVGITTQIAVQVFLNIAVITNMIPPTGISLPFFSYGGTALLIQMAEMGVVLGVSRQIPAARQG